jgi:D-serine deaminase-like pyridoxal phosphate-dependent protein
LLKNITQRFTEKAQRATESKILSETFLISKILDYLLLCGPLCLLCVTQCNRKILRQNLNMKYFITKPTLLIDEFKCRRNIASMSEKAKRNKILFRPHFKTHQSHEIGRWFRELGIDKITVSSLSMAEYFASDKWNDITVAFPVNVLEIETINRLAGQITLNLLVESVESVKLLNKGLQHDINVFIKIDIGNHRTGFAYDDILQIDTVLAAIDTSGHIRFAGFLSHAGQSYDAGSFEEISGIHYESIARLTRLKKHYAERYPHLLLSTGDTPTCSVMEDFSGIDEIRPGNFVFYDLMQSRIGSCSNDEIAVTMACPVVAIHKERNELIIYGGAVHFSKERIEDNAGGIIYGKGVEDREEDWGEPIEGMYVSALSQEHGIVQVPSHLIDHYKIGDIIKILPVHSCLTSQAMKGYLTTQGKIISRF